MTDSLSPIEECRIVSPLFDQSLHPPPVSPRQLAIKVCEPDVAMRLNRLWHSRMPKADFYRLCSPCYAAIFENYFYAVALWSLPMAANRIKNGSLCLELRRLAIAPDAPKYTATYMLGAMRKHIQRTRPDIYRLISYQDTGVHTGTIYKAANWTPCAQGTYVSWGIHSKRPGRIEQSVAPKIRWELQLRSEPPESTRTEFPSPIQEEMFF